MSLVAMGQAAKAAAFELAVTSTADKNRALLAMAEIQFAAGAKAGRCLSNFAAIRR